MANFRITDTTMTSPVFAGAKFNAFAERVMKNLPETALNELRDHVLLMGGEVERAIDEATRALIERDSELAEQVLRDDDRVDALELEADQRCVQLLRMQASEEYDLRLVVTAIKITPILERIADHACNIARAAIYLNDEPQLKPYFDLPKMSWLACDMLRLSLDAFAAADANAARAVIARDDEIDRLYDRIFHELLDRMSKDAAAAGRAARLLLVAKHLERIGDYVTDICELIVYMKEALVIKHSQLAR
ncbi:MAG TPA: phosphate signaling complex protein PhoU [Blastocatellia bacterium]|nr:phosphate signaling complex protein PhoU [Blastocatellia bacterium]HMX26923.1 phosphate signaling complex protein PhoU [Blastocatellia bacterium]HMY70811.1 phosphate signaling complex protein PhoU [Blastocatellia bacterium]HMZ17285.1 phosphate signaling complex protein PhoU [Blastocatellia bacterium]HNG30612.1 phosphate signaling complex protein PhoU [Blastocatellia bacterium]